jgi:S-adenosylmethionine:tRNA ribosyltransferase-isomerase
MGREPEALDSERYQTVFARRTGAVAAPTAGLHFTPRLLEAIRKRGVEVLYVTLHTGPATFLPIRDNDAAREGPGTEAYTIEPGVYDAVQRARKEGRRVIAVGTTTVRALESAARGQGGAPALSGKTGLFIRPGFEFRVIDGLITNFHLPRSTLLMLTSAFGGHGHVMAAYAEAVRRRYRFYSYGDAMFIS